MNIFGIGMQEMGIIVVAALLIFGPGKLPEVMSQAGKYVRDFRRMTSELTGEFEKTVAEAQEIGKSMTGELGGMKSQVNSVTDSVKRDLGVNKGTGTTKSTATKPGLTKTGSSVSSTKSSASKSTSTSKAKSTTAASSNAKSTTGTAAAKKTTTSTTKKAAPPVATREDPVADVSLFDPTPIERASRSRRATPAVIADRTPRSLDEPVVAAEVTAAVPSVVDADDPLARARQRRRTAGYARRSA